MIDYDATDRQDETPLVLPCVAAFITRDTEPERELLVLRPASGTAQLPAMMVPAGETPPATVVRCAGALVGLSSLLKIRRLAVVRERLPDMTRVVLHSTPLYAGPSFAAPPLRFRMERGMRVSVREWQEEFARVSYEEYRYDADELKIATHRSGWLTTDSFSCHIAHHLFHVPVSAAHVTAHGEWVRLSRAEGLKSIHQRWYERALPRLR
jgi:hypothetical protein